MQSTFLTDDNETYLIIEETKASFADSQHKSTLTGPLDAHRVLHIARVHIVCFSTVGCYLSRNLGRFPHYMVTGSMIQSTVIDQCKKWSIPIKIHHSHKEFSTSDCIFIWQLGQEVESITQTTTDHDTGESFEREKHSMLEDKIRSQLKQQLLLLGMDDDLLVDFDDQVCGRHQDKGLGRGAKQLHFGYTSGHSLARADHEGEVSVRPQLIGGQVPMQWKKVHGYDKAW